MAETGAAPAEARDLSRETPTQVTEWPAEGEVPHDKGDHGSAVAVPGKAKPALGIAA